MKLTHFFRRAQRRARDADEVDEPLRLEDAGPDRSSMAELVRLLQQADRPRQESGERPS